MNILDLLFPSKCVLCGKTGQYFCPECVSKIKPVNQICPVCEQGSFFGKTHSFCQTKLNLDGLISFFAYSETIRAAIHKLKYKYVTDLKDEVWALIEKELTKKQDILKVFENFLQQEKPVIIPIPLYWYKENVRGFNQSGLLAKELSRYYNLEFSDKILIRHKPTPTQTTLSPKERRTNVKDAFSVDRNCSIVKLLNCLIVDDVWTTGATLQSATAILKKAGAKKVWGLTLAR